LLWTGLLVNREKRLIYRGFAMSLRVALIALWMLMTPLAAAAQTAPVQVQFVGTITSSASDTLTIRQADGSQAPWTGPLPDFPYNVGDQVTVSFSAQPGAPATPVDGIYRYSVVGRSQTGIGGGGTGTALLGGMDVSGPIRPSGQWESATGLVLTFNSNTNQWSMEMPSGGYTLSEFDGPGFTYDRATNTLASSSTTAEPRFGCGDVGAGCFNIGGTMTGGAINRVAVWGTDGSLAGLFSMLFSGNWFVNGQQVGGGPVDVPEPGQTGLFALAALAIMLRARRRAFA
jgi:hypothetical protein